MTAFTLRFIRLLVGVFLCIPFHYFVGAEGKRRSSFTFGCVFAIDENLANLFYDLVQSFLSKHSYLLAYHYKANDSNNRVSIE